MVDPLLLPLQEVGCPYCICEYNTASSFPPGPHLLNRTPVVLTVHR